MKFHSHIYGIYFLIHVSILCPQIMDRITGSNRFFDVVYKTAGRDLYNQDEITKSALYKVSCIDDKKNLLRTHFYKRKIEARFEYLSSELTSQLPLVTIIAPFVIIAYRYRDKISSKLVLGILFTCNRSLQEQGDKLLRLATTIVSELKKIYGISHKYFFDYDEAYELEYITNKPWIAPEFQDIIEDNYIELFSREWSLKADDLLRDSIRLALSLPREVKEITYNDVKIKEGLNGYPLETLKDLRRYAIRHVAACREENVRKVAAYFYGIPGVGKTRAIKLIAQALDLPVEILSLADVKLEDLIGNSEKPGLLLKTISRVTLHGLSAKNMILGIDDADRIILNPQEYALSSFILTLFEPETKSFYSPYLKCTIDISHLGIILAGNRKIEDEALASRLHVVHFGAYDNDYKKEVVWKDLFPNMLTLHLNAAHSLNLEDFTQEDTIAINNMVENDTSGGFRTIKLELMKYLEDKVLCKYYALSCPNVE